MCNKRKILIVDDDPKMGKTLSDILRRKGYAPVSADKGKSALEIVKDDTPAVALIDQKLPDMNGMELIRELKKQFPKTMYIIITGYASQMSAIEAVNLGAYSYMKKPYDVEQLLITISKAIEKLETEEALRLSEKRYRSLYESSKDGIIFSDIQGNLIDANRAFLDMLGYTKEEIKKLNYKKLTPKKWNKMEEDIIKNQIIARGYSDEYEKEYTKKDGTIFPVTVRAWLIKDEQVKHLGMWAIIRDIIENKKMEQMLIQSEKMASIGLLAAGVAHEINNPIGYIHSNLKTLEKYNKKFNDFNNFIKTLIEEYSKEMIDENKNLAGKLKKFKEEIKVDYFLSDMKDAIEESIEGTEKVKRIVSDLTYFSREEKPEMKLADINQGIEKTIDIVRNELKYKAKVIKEFGDIPKIECDIQKLNQVFMNILINATQAIERQGTIKIKTFSADNSVVIQISDTGIGIAKENIGKIFDAFFTTKKSGEGTGLGLSISYRIIQEHNGIIELESEVGKGTTFTICLPIKKSEPVKKYKKLNSLKIN